METGTPSDGGTAFRPGQRLGGAGETRLREGTLEGVAPSPAIYHGHVDPDSQGRVAQVKPVRRI